MTTTAPAPSTPVSLVNRVLSDVACPHWVKEMDTFLSVKSQFVLYGNIRDSFAFPMEDGPCDIRNIHDYITDFLHAKGIEVCLLVDPIKGISILTPLSVAPRRSKKRGDFITRTASRLDERLKGTDFNFAKAGRWAPGSNFDNASILADILVRPKDEPPDFPVAIIFDYMMGHAQKESVDGFVRSLIASYEVRPTTLGIYSPIIWLCDRENELPAWFSLNNPRVRSISIGYPDPSVRRRVCHSLLANDEAYGLLPEETREKVLASFVGQTDGLTINDIASIAHFRSVGGLKVEEIADAARRYKLGITDDPWKRMLEGKTAGTFVKEKRIQIDNRVKGQPAAVESAVDIIGAAVRGVSSQGAVGKPKGILFLVGPTGTGKTELAKSIAEALYGDERAMKRFDMAEYGSEHSDQRLYGAPPGYVGYENGGQLTQAIQQKPCSVVLFDEIEKMHVKLWDKFLAILDEGRITSGKGEPVYFSETVICFTSNLGMKAVNDRIKANDGVLPSYAELVAILNGEIDAFFAKIDRPEIRKRIGENIVVFDFIRPAAARQIFKKTASAVLARFKEQQGVSFQVVGFDEMAEGTAMAQLCEVCTKDLTGGGRGIGERVNVVLNKGLTRWLNEREAIVQNNPGRVFVISGIATDADGRTTLTIA